MAMTVIDSTIPVAVPVILSSDPGERYRVVSLFAGMWITLVSGDFAIAGKLVEVRRPDYSFDEPAPLVTIDTGRARVRGPVLSGDILAAQVSLLEDLRLEPATDSIAADPWQLVAKVLPLLVPGTELSEITKSRGAISIRGKTPSVTGHRYFIAVLCGEDETRQAIASPPPFRVEGARADGNERIARMGLSRYRSEIDANYYSNPWATWLRPVPGAMTAWVAGILLTAESDWPRSRTRI